MEIVKVFRRDDILKVTRKRSTEKKIGEMVNCSEGNWRIDLENSKSKFVIVGVPEDIGVRANYGRAGAASAFKPAIDSFLSQQHNIFFNGEHVFVLGELVVDDLMQKADGLDAKKKSDLTELRNLVEIIDERLYSLIELIVSLGKIPVIIGGGHNNAFGAIKGTSRALKSKINVVNCDPHLDFRPVEGRHSGNAFTYAFEQNYMHKYAVLAMHEQYNNGSSLAAFRDHSDKLFYKSYESIFVREEVLFSAAIKQCLGFVQSEPCGLELDLDAIINVPSSAKTSSGLTPLQARQYVYQAALQLRPTYFHVAEGAPVLSHIKADNKTGKLIAYLITDFMKAYLSENPSD